MHGCRVYNPLLTPTRANLFGDHADLRVSQHSASALGEGRHRCSSDTVGGDFADGSIVCNGQVNRIGKRDCCSPASFGTVTASAVFRVQSAKFQNLVWRQNFRTLARLAVGRAATREQNCGGRREYTKMPKSVHRCFSPLSLGGIIPGASIPARTTKGRFSRVETRSCRTTTMPATTPKAICEAINQIQMMRLASKGLRSCIIEYRSPDQSTGAISPPSTIGRRANMGSIAP